jgi:hypothetical protein
MKDYYVEYKRYKHLYKQAQEGGGDVSPQRVCKFVNNNRMEGIKPVKKFRKTPYHVECKNEDGHLVGKYDRFTDEVLFYDSDHSEIYRIVGPFEF